MDRFKNFKAISRAFGVVAAVVIVVSGITFAALQSQQVKLTGNSIQTASANLQISTDGTYYASSLSGFSFSAIVPGGSAVPQSGYPIFVKNTGNASLGLKFAVSSVPSNPDSVDLSKVNIILTPTSSGTPQSFTLQSLITSASSGGTAISVPNSLFAGNTATFTLKVSMDGDAISGSGASLGSIDFAFSGQAQSN